MAEFEVTLLTRDGGKIQVPCAETNSVLSAAESAGYFLPAMCHEGTCGLCHAHVDAGRYQMEAYSSSALPVGDPDAVLLCRCVPQENLTVTLPYDQTRILKQKVPVREAVIESLGKAWEGAVAVTLRLLPDKELGQSVEFMPGQYMELTIPGTEIHRAYSLANLPNWEGKLDFLIRLQPGGAFSTWLGQQAKVGDKVTVRGPFGDFVLDETSVRPRCFVGGGCGMAPIKSMLRHLGEFQDSQPTHLIFGANREVEMPPDADFAEMRAALPQIDVTLAVMKPEGEWQGFAGTAPAALEAYLAQSKEPVDIYACGPPKMLEAVQAILDKRGAGDRLIAEQL